jgi:hypothetical protein
LIKRTQFKNKKDPVCSSARASSNGQDLNFIGEDETSSSPTSSGPDWFSGTVVAPPEFFPVTKTENQRVYPTRIFTWNPNLTLVSSNNALKLKTIRTSKKLKKTKSKTTTNQSKLVHPKVLVHINS